MFLVLKNYPKYRLLLSELNMRTTSTYTEKEKSRCLASQFSHAPFVVENLAATEIIGCIVYVFTMSGVLISAANVLGTSLVSI